MPVHEEEHTIKQLHSMARKARGIQDRVHSHVQQQQLQAMLHNASDVDEFAFSTDHTSRSTSSSGARTSLLAHQRHGVRWLLALRALRMNAVLADEMGLGKTVQIVNFLTALACRDTQFGTHLIVAPLSTLENWRVELQRWAPWLHCVVHHGQAQERRKQRDQIRRRHRRAFDKAEVLRERWQAGAPVEEMARDIGGVVLTSYEMVRIDSAALVKCLHWDVIIVDEAQRIKNLDCLLLQSLKSATCQMRVILTGTPIQNNVTELWALLEYTAPQLFDFKEKQTKIRSTLESCVRGQRSAARKRTRCETSSSVDEDNNTITSSPFLDEATRLLHAALSPFVLRRTKQSAGIALPPKMEITIPVPLTPMQRHVYEGVQREDKYLNNRLMHLQKCCLHPFLVDADLARCMTTTNDVSYSSSHPLIAMSGKMQLIHEMLPALKAAGHRVLLFSHMTRMLDIVEEFLQQHHKDLSYVRLDGCSDQEERSRSIDAFKGTAASSSLAISRMTPVCMGNIKCGIQEDDCVFKTPTKQPVKREVLGSLPVNAVAPLDQKKVKKVTFLSPERHPPAPQVPPPAATDIEKKEDPCFLFLVSTKAGGVGLNLTGADTVILLDGDYNPHTDRQAIDRCHRIGQTRPVAVYRLLSPDTVETAQLSTAHGKLNLEHMILREGGGGASDGGRHHLYGGGSGTMGLEGSSACVCATPAPEDPKRALRFVPMMTEDFAAETIAVPPCFPTKPQLEQLLDRTALLQRVFS